MAPHLSPFTAVKALETHQGPRLPSRQAGGQISLILLLKGKNNGGLIGTLRKVEEVVVLRPNVTLISKILPQIDTSHL